MGIESKSPRDRANLYHTGSQVTQSPEQLPHTQKGNNDPTWAENSIPPASAGVPENSSLGFWPHLAPQLLPLLSVWQGSLPAAPYVLSLADKEGSLGAKIMLSQPSTFPPPDHGPHQAIMRKARPDFLEAFWWWLWKEGSWRHRSCEVSHAQTRSITPLGPTHTRCQEPSAAKALRTNQHAGVTGMSTHWLILQP